MFLEMLAKESLRLESAFSIHSFMALVLSIAAAAFAVVAESFSERISFLSVSSEFFLSASFARKVSVLRIVSLTASSLTFSEIS